MCPGHQAWRRRGRPRARVGRIGRQAGRVRSPLRQRHAKMLRAALPIDKAQSAGHERPQLQSASMRPARDTATRKPNCVFSSPKSRPQRCDKTRRVGCVLAAAHGCAAVASAHRTCARVARAHPARRGSHRSRHRGSFDPPTSALDSHWGWLPSPPRNRPRMYESRSALAIWAPGSGRTARDQNSSPVSRAGAARPRWR